MICRLCLKNINVENKISLFSAAENNGETEIVKMIAKYFFIELNQHDALSCTICQECCNHLEEFHKFYIYIEKQQSTLRNEFLEVKCDVELDDNDVIADIGGFQQEDSQNDVKDVLMLDSKPLQEQPLELELKCEIDVEREVLTPDILGHSDILADSTDDDLPLKELLRRKKKKVTKPKVEKNESKLKKVKVKRQKAATVSKSATTENTTNDRLKQTNKETPNLELSSEAAPTAAGGSGDKREKRKKQTAEESAEMDEFIANYMPLKCDLCDTPFKTFAEMRPHYVELHKRPPYAVCCAVHFNRRQDLYEHIQCHLNPDYFKCDICGRVLKSRNSLKAHHINKHIDHGERMYNCEICDKKFARPAVLQQHLTYHKAQKNHNCQHCSKSFINKQRLEKHIRSMHDNIFPHICDVCGQKFKFKPSFDRHVLEHQGIVQPPEQCSQCGEWFKNKDRIRLHMAKHNLVDVNCKYCGRVCASQKALRGHIQYMHRRLAKHKCSYCDKAFKTISAFKEHEATHTGAILYNCPHCAKECRSSANMYVHVKRQHPQEWLAAQLARPSKAPQTLENS